MDKVVRTFTEKVDYWLGLLDIDNKESIRDLFIRAENVIKIVDNDKGVIAYTIAPDFKGGLALIEIFFFLKPEYRTLSNANELLALIEHIAYTNKCNSIKMGSNFGYKDDSFIKYLRRKGYKDDTLSKEIQWQH